MSTRSSSLVRAMYDKYNVFLCNALVTSYNHIIAAQLASPKRSSVYEANRCGKRYMRVAVLEQILCSLTA